MTDFPKVRCAVYTRKSRELGLEQEFNSLHAQRDAGVSYIASQRGRGWELLNEEYNDGGWSGGTMDRPAIKRLYADIEKGLIDVVVVYKIDRLSRSQLDFLNMIEFFKKHKVTFVSVTQNFDTSTPMGELMLSNLISFAQFERKQTAERIRDKVAASKAKGIWMGGQTPIGYMVKDRKLHIIPEEAEIIRFMFESYLKCGSLLKLQALLNERGAFTKARKKKDGSPLGGIQMSNVYIHRILNNPLYIGQIKHKDKLYKGEHEPIVSEELWAKVHGLLPKDSVERKQMPVTSKMPAILKGIIFDQDDTAMTPSFTRKGDRLYRYYVNTRAMKHGYETVAVKIVPAEQIENFVVGKIRELIDTPEMIMKVHQQARHEDGSITLAYIRDALGDFNHLWRHLFPLEQARIIQLVVRKIIVSPHGLHINFHKNGFAALCEEVTPRLEENVA